MKKNLPPSPEKVVGKHVGRLWSDNPAVTEEVVMLLRRRDLALLDAVIERINVYVAQNGWDVLRQIRERMAKVSR